MFSINPRSSFTWGCLKFSDRIFYPAFFPKCRMLILFSLLSIFFFLAGFALQSSWPDFTRILLLFFSLVSTPYPHPFNQSSCPLCLPSTTLSSLTQNGRRARSISRYGSYNLRYWIQGRQIFTVFDSYNRIFSSFLNFGPFQLFPMPKIPFCQLFSCSLLSFRSAQMSSPQRSFYWSVYLKLFCFISQCIDFLCNAYQNI